MKTIKVGLGKRSYRILIGNRILPGLGAVLKKMRLGNAAVIITNPLIRRKFGNGLRTTLENNNFIHKILEIPDSETSKSKEVAFKVIERIAEWDTGKKIFVVALGGGVVGDLAGFVASIYKRGIGYVQIPTTLLAQIDSSIGGKVAIDLSLGKNLVGAFYQPKLVFSDISFLRSLGKREIRSGLAEAIKYAVILDKPLFTFIEKNCKKLFKLDPQVMERIVVRCSQLKAMVVERDERESKGVRTILNFGHTVGHAVEAAAGYKTITHGEAIGFGMVCAAEISRNLGLLNDTSCSRITNLVRKVGLPTRISRLKPCAVMRALSHDKKFIAGKNRFVLPVAIGRVMVKEAIPTKAIIEVLSARLI